MILLAVDTSGKNGSLALARVTPAQGDVEVLEVVALAGGTFSAQLVPQLAALLQKHGCQKRDLAGFAVVSGPGSFTGLRVGLAAMKALAEVLKRPIGAVSLLEAVARSSSHERALAVLDAGRGEVYVGDDEAGSHRHMRSERLMTREELAAAAKDRNVVTPDESVAAFLNASGIQVELIAYPRSDVIARLGWERLLRGEALTPGELDANYIRRSDAEIFSKPQL